MIANAGLVVGSVVGLVFLVAGLLLLRRPVSRGGPLLITLGAALFLGAELYGVFVLRPFVGRSFDEEWHEQLETVDAFATVGLLVCAVGLLAHARRVPK